MAKYVEIEGDLIQMFLNHKFDAIAHGCNCFCSMGGGFAEQVAVKIPEAKQADNLTTAGDLLKLGSLSLAVTDCGIVYNLYTQYYGGANIDYEAVILSLRKMAKMIKGKGWKIAFPLIGAGIAGGDWKVISNHIRREFSEEDVTIVIYNK